MIGPTPPPRRARSKTTPLIYRVHDSPSKEKLTSREFLGPLGLEAARGGAVKAASSTISSPSRASPAAERVGEVILRSPAQAEYSADNPAISA